MFAIPGSWSQCLEISLWGHGIPTYQAWDLLFHILAIVLHFPHHSTISKRRLLDFERSINSSRVIPIDFSISSHVLDSFELFSSEFSAWFPSWREEISFDIAEFHRFKEMQTLIILFVSLFVYYETHNQWLWQSTKEKTLCVKCHFAKTIRIVVFQRHLLNSKDKHKLQSIDAIQFKFRFISTIFDTVSLYIFLLF